MAVHRDDETKLFPITVLLQNASLSLLLPLRDFGMSCPDSGRPRLMARARFCNELTALDCASYSQRLV
jgi:hypothetical protein